MVEVVVVVVVVAVAVAVEVATTPTIHCSTTPFRKGKRPPLPRPLPLAVRVISTLIGRFFWARGGWGGVDAVDYVT